MIWLPPPTRTARGRSGSCRHFLFADKDAGSLEVGKSGDFIVLGRDILALADAGQVAQAANTKVLSTYFMGNRVYQSNP